MGGDKIMFQFEKINIGDLIVISVLGIALIMAIFLRDTQLSMSIASGLLGYIGGTVRSNITNKNEKVGNEK